MPSLIARKLGSCVNPTTMPRPDVPDTATGLNATNFLTAGVTITNAVASQGSCTNYTNSISANLGSLAAGASATVTVTIEVVGWGTT